jgi:hypothetical protein
MGWKLLRAIVAALALTAVAVAGCDRPGSAVGQQIQLDETDKGHTVRVAPGERITVVLHSTYWRFAPLPSTDVLSMDGEPVVAAAPPGTCVPGGGCGTVTAGYFARGVGSTALTASRTSCGEALGCSPDQASFSVTLVVGEAATPAAMYKAADAPLVASEADNGRTGGLRLSASSSSSTYGHVGSGS